MARPRAHIDLAAVADAFAADGLHGTGAGAVAAAAGVAKPTLYARGEGKDALFLRAVEAEVERIVGHLDAAERAGAGLRARDRAAAAVEALLAHAAERPAGRRLLSHTAHHATSGVATHVAEALRRVPDRIAAGLARDLAADGLDATAAPFLARALHGAACELAEPRPGERRPARARLAAMVAAMVPVPLADEDWPVA